MANPTITTAPAEEPVTLAEVKAQLRVDFSTDDTLLDSLILTARRRLEIYCNRWFVKRTADFVKDRFPCWGKPIFLPGGLLVSISSIKYYETDDTENVLATTVYSTATKSEPGAAVLKYGQSWPSTTLRPSEGVKVTYIAGYEDAAAVPDDIKHALLLYVTHLYKHRGDTDEKIPGAVANLLWPHRIVTL